MRFQLLIFTFLLICDLLLIVYCAGFTPLTLNGGAVEKNDKKAAAQKKLTGPLRSYETDLSAFDSIRMSVIKKAFQNLDFNFLKKLSHDLYELNAYGALRPLLILRPVEKAYQNSIMIESFKISRIGFFKAAVKVSGSTAANNFFINFSDYLARAEGIENFTFEVKHLHGAGEKKENERIHFTVNYDSSFNEIF